MNLCVPTHKNLMKDNRLSEAEIQRVAHKIHSVSAICNLIEARDGPKDPERERRIAEYIRKIHEDYDGKVLVRELPPDPPIRGMYGEAYILLKEGAIPQRQKSFFMHGERKEAMQKITEDWLSKQFIERPTKAVDWVSQSFAVPKKSATFPLRGVVDMRGVNSQTRQCNYPLPNIENILVKQGRNHIFSIMDLCKAFHQQPMAV